MISTSTKTRHFAFITLVISLSITNDTLPHVHTTLQQQPKIEPSSYVLSQSAYPQKKNKKEERKRNTKGNCMT